MGLIRLGPVIFLIIHAKVLLDRLVIVAADSASSSSDIKIRFWWRPGVAGEPSIRWLGGHVPGHAGLAADLGA